MTYDDKFGGRSLLNGDDPRLAQKDAEISKLKNQVEHLIKTWRHYEKLAKDFSSKEHIASGHLKRVMAENERLRRYLEDIAKAEHVVYCNHKARMALLK